MPGLSGKHVGLRVTEVVEQEYGFDAPAASGLRLPPDETQSLPAPPPIPALSAPVAEAFDPPADAPTPLHPESTEPAGDDASSATHAA
jgi:hypothetical protein